MAERPMIMRNRALVDSAAARALLVCVILSAWRESVRTATDVLVLVTLVVAAVATGDRLAGITAALSSAVWFDFFLTEPYLRFTITDPEDIEATILLLVIGATVTEVALWGPPGAGSGEPQCRLPRRCAGHRGARAGAH